MNQLETILSEISIVMKRINVQDIEALSLILQEGRRIFVVGEGRSGFMAKSFAMRLMHLGADVYVIGETITEFSERESPLRCVSTPFRDGMKVRSDTECHKKSKICGTSSI